MPINLKAKTRFVSDFNALTRKMDRAEKLVLFRMGGYIRTVSRRSIRQSKRKSNPGDPPKGKTGRVRNNIYFAVRPGKVIVGPTTFRGRNLRHLEYGGRGWFVSSAPSDVRPGGFFGKPQGTRRLGKFAARPFMRPALDTTLNSRVYRTVWANAVR